MPRAIVSAALVALLLATTACTGSSNGPAPDGTTNSIAPSRSSTATSATPPAPRGGVSWRIDYRSNSGGGWRTVLTTGALTRTAADSGVPDAALRRCGFDPATDALVPLQFVDTNLGYSTVPGSGAGLALSAASAGPLSGPLAEGAADERLRPGQAVRLASANPPWFASQDATCPVMSGSSQPYGYFVDEPLAPGDTRTARAALVLENYVLASAPAGDRSLLAKLWFSAAGTNGSIGDTELVAGPRVGELGRIFVNSPRWFFPVDGRSAFHCASATDDRSKIARCRATPAGAP